MFIKYLTYYFIHKYIWRYQIVVNVRTQPAFDVIGIIAFPPRSRKKGKFINLPFTEVEFTRSMAVAE